MADPRLMEPDPTVNPQVTDAVTQSAAEGAEAPTMEAEAVVAEASFAHLAEPGQRPPTEVLVEAEAEGIAAWHNGKKIVALWSNASPRNAFISVPGMGWKRLSNANDSSYVSLTMLASHAEQTNSTVNLRLEADGKVHEIYVW